MLLLTKAIVVLTFKNEKFECQIVLCILLELFEVDILCK